MHSNIITASEILLKYIKPTNDFNGDVTRKQKKKHNWDRHEHRAWSSVNQEHRWHLHLQINCLSCSAVELTVFNQCRNYATFWSSYRWQLIVFVDWSIHEQFRQNLLYFIHIKRLATSTMLFFFFFSLGGERFINIL